MTAIDRLVAWNRHEQQVRAATAPCRYDFDAHGDLTKIVEADGTRRAYTYDAARRLVEARGAGGTSRYRYDAHDRLVEVEGPAGSRRHVFDATGRLVVVHRGAAGGVRYVYDPAGRVVEYRTAEIACSQRFDATGRLVGVAQRIGAVELTARLDFDAAGRLAEMTIPGHRIGYRWNGDGRLEAVELDGRPLAHWSYHDRVATTRHAGGVVLSCSADPVDGRPLARRLQAADSTPIAAATYRYDEAMRCVDDGEHRYAYDAQGRLAEESTAGRSVAYAYDRAGTRLDTSPSRPEHRFDALGRLAEVRVAGEPVAHFAYDAKGRLATLDFADGRHERWLHGPADELLAVTDRAGRVLRAYVHTPTGCLAEILAEEGEAGIRFLHLDRRGHCTVATDAAGRVLRPPACDAWGAPLESATAAAPWFNGRRYVAAVGLYRIGARWYDPHAGRFVEADSYTAAPDDERLVHPLVGSAAQVALRTQLLPGWLRQPAARHPHAFGANDPVNRVDPNGHWSFGGVLLTLLGAIWTLPNTLFGLVLEITCLVGEVVRWLAWLVSGGALTWATPGFDAASSSHLNAFALVFRGGWLGSFKDILGITFGNVFFVYHEWEGEPGLNGFGSYSPKAYGGTVQIREQDALYEHELRHTNQYGWLGPFFHLGLPLFGVYEWDTILHGYQDAWTETDARDHAGFPP